MQSQLRKRNDVLAFEFSMNIDDGKREFIISADGILSAFPDVIQLVDSAPNLDQWAIAAFPRDVARNRFRLTTRSCVSMTCSLIGNQQVTGSSI